ncbi:MULTISPECIES: zinc ribbon domain-containing protein [Heyndrickxia]|uniref:Zinc ribbon domain-containing protein n=2 Tax=Heyndrickxia sporothermodurans TaxID=46224 RepID=A0A150L9T5_9BACI|nr:zinc ribbon domain-containing protein [Heyndrickxia sporothermodurans]KYD09091.1 hypothetical protein B4102_2618 [Heyndrickxia sporothermodurans]
MKCPNCQHENEGGNFCENCGTRLLEQAGNEVAASATHPIQTPSEKAQSNQYVEATKKISKQYFQYFIQVLKKPYANSHSVGEEHFVNGIITIILYSLFIPFILYFGVKILFSGINRFGSLFGANINAGPPFAETVIIPFFGYLVLTILVITFTFAAIRLGKVQVGYKEVLARFSSFLIPFVAILLIGLIFAIIKIKFFLAIFLLGFFGSILMVPPLVIASYKKENHEGLDVIFGSLIIYVLTYLSILIMGDLLFNALKVAFNSMFGGFLGL